MRRCLFLIGLGFFLWAGMLTAGANSNVHVTRFWHNHQPIYWPEWNSGVGQDLRVQYAHDSMRLKPTQNYGAPWNHPHNDLEQIFGLNDRLAAYQGRPRDSVASIGQAGGMAMSYTGSLIDNVRNLAANGWGYSGDWNAGNTEARNWTTTRGGPRLDMVGFSYHHSLTPLLPKEVLRKEIQIFKEAWWKAWGGNPDKSDHSRGFFPTEMAYSRDIIDVLVDEGYEWLIVASHHISRTSPSYNDRVTPESFNIKSSPPNRADQLGPRFDNEAQWWFDEPNPGQAAWNVAPYAYHLHRVEYVDPETGDVKSMIAVPSDDVLSYQAGYSGAQIGAVDAHIAPWATDPSLPLIVMPATDGDNAWGGGFDSWMVSTPSFFGAAQQRGYQINSIQDFVNEFGANAPTTHIEEGAWIYPEMCYGSPYFLKWIEPPVRPSVDSPTTYPNTVIDIENGWALKFFAYAPKMAGANWVITAEQILRDQGGDVQAWKIQAPYDWDGTWTGPNEVELAWHIYLKGLDSGFQYYGGLGNDDETKPGLAVRRTIETLQDFMSTRLHLDETGPTVLKPQRFPFNPGGYTFGWFNHVPEDDHSYLKKNPSEFYIWTLAHDVSGIETVNLRIRHTHYNEQFRNGHHQNLTFAGGEHVSDWISIPMTRRVLPNTREELNAIAGHGEIDFVVTSPEIADQFFVKIDDFVYPDFRGRYFDYYIEAVDSRGNASRTEIQHVFVEDDGETPASYARFSPDPNDCSPLTVTYYAANGPLEGMSPITMWASFDSGNTWTDFEMALSEANIWTYTFDPFVPDKPSSVEVWFESESISDSRDGQNWSTSIRDCDLPVGPSTVVFDPAAPDGCDPVTIRYYPNEGPLQGVTSIDIHVGVNGWVDPITVEMTPEGIYWEFTFDPPEGTEEINVVFNGDGVWDNNSGQDWSVTVTNCEGELPEPPPELPVVSTLPESPVGCDPIVIRYNPAGRPLAGASLVRIHIGRNGWQDVIVDPNPLMTRQGTIWIYEYDTPYGTEEINFAFTDGAGIWDNNQGSDWSVAVADCGDGPLPPSGFAITNPPQSIVVSSNIEEYELQGIADDVVGDIVWTNLLTATGGQFAAANPWTAPMIALGVGQNEIVLTAEVPGSGEDVTVAQDSSGAYTGGWSSGDNRGTGFGPWTLNTFGGQAGLWATDPRGWGFWSHAGDNMAEAIRAFQAPLTEGQTFHVQMQNGWIWEEAGSVGIALRNESGDTIWQLYFNGGESNYFTSAGESDIPYTDAGLDIAFTVTDPGTYSVVVDPDSGDPHTFTSEFSGDIVDFRAWSSNNGTNDEDNDERDFFINDLSITEVGSVDPVWVSAAVNITRQAESDTDSNGDGVPDQWYLEYDPELDVEKSSIQYIVGANGHTLSASYWLGLNPSDPDSALRINSDTEMVAGQMTITWPSVGGRRYRVQFSDHLAHGFNDLVIRVETNVPYGESSTLTHTDTTAGNRGLRSYRVKFDGIQP